MPITTAMLLSLALAAPDDRTQVEMQASLVDDGLAGQLAQGRAYETSLRVQTLVTLPRHLQRRIFAGSRMPSPTLRFGGAAGTSAHTPSDLASPAVDRDDRPYTGMTFGAAIVELSDGARNRLRAQLAYAAIGPQSGADRFHTAWKRATIGAAPRGWTHQTRNELHFDLKADWDRVLAVALPLRHAHVVDVLTHARVELAELAVAGSAGATVRMGLLRRPFVGVPHAAADRVRARCRDFRCRQRRSVQAFVYARADAGVVGRRTTVDGSLFDRADDPDRSPHRARSRRFVPTGEVGLVVQPMEHFDVRFAVRHVGPEVAAAGAVGHTTGRIAVTTRF